MYITEKQLQPPQNNFNLLRLIAAVFVFLSHSYDVRNISQKELLAQLTHGRYLLSTMGLIIFFTMSGFLICKSLVTIQSIKQYLLNRFLRIWPAFAVCTILTILVLGLLFTTLPPITFLTHHQTLFFLFKNLSLTGTSLWLPGVFNNNGVNASVWTIPIEVRLYIILLLLFILSKKKLKQVVIITIVASLIIQAFIPSKSFTIILGRTTYATLTLGTFFFIGAAFYLFKEKIPFTLAAWLLLFITWLICYIWLPNAIKIIDYLFFSYSFLAISFYTPAISGKTDISYGFYLYAYPIQKAVQTVLGEQLNFTAYILLCALCITIIAMLSWVTIEKRALQRKSAWKTNSQ